MQPWTNVTFVAKPTSALCKHPWQGICFHIHSYPYGCFISPLMVTFPHLQPEMLPHNLLFSPFLPIYQGAAVVLTPSLDADKPGRLDAPAWWSGDFPVTALWTKCNIFTYILNIWQVRGRHSNLINTIFWRPTNKGLRYSNLRHNQNILKGSAISKRLK